MPKKESFIYILLPFLFFQLPYFPPSYPNNNLVCLFFCYEKSHMVKEAEIKYDI